MTAKSFAALFISILFVQSVNAQDNCVPEAFSITFEGKCSYEKLLSAYTERWHGPLLGNVCGPSFHNASQALNTFLGDPENLDKAVRSLCLGAAEETVTMPSMSSYEASDEWLKAYFDGNTDWTEEVETELTGNVEVVEPHGTAKNHLKKDGENIRSVFEQAKDYQLKYPNSLSNFNEDQCELNSVMCCWVQDRQANDNNGNCAKPYDTNCIDKDPADNTDLCLVHHDRNPSGTQNSGLSIFEGDNNNGEGPIHCHGFAWSNDPLDMESRFKGNNLFFVSMYDHLYQRGYTRNVPNAPMCACVEQMPVVTRSDCTQTDVTETYKFTYDPIVSPHFIVSIENIAVKFNSCQGLGRNNDLSSYVARLQRDGKLTYAQKNALKEHLVENGNCDRAIKRNLASKGFIAGFPDGAYSEQYDFPLTKTNEFVHGFCVVGAESANAFSSNFDLSYKVVKNFVDGTKAWSDRDYTIHGVENGPCAGGYYLRPTRHKTIDRFTEITVGMNPTEYGSICALLPTHDIRHGQWPEKLMNEGFTKIVPDLTNVTSGFRVHLTEDVALTAYCKELPAQPTVAPTLAPTFALDNIPNVLEASGDTYIRNGKYKFTNYGSDVHIRVKNDKSDDFDRRGIVVFDVKDFLRIPNAADMMVTLRLYVKSVGSDPYRSISVSSIPYLFDYENIGTWDNLFDILMSKRGNSIGITPNDAGSWVDISVTSLFSQLLAENSNDTQLALKLSVLKTDSSESVVDFGSREDGYAPQLYASTAFNMIDASKDAYIQGGSYDEVRYGLETGLLVKNDKSSSYDRRAIIEFDLSQISISETSKAEIHLYVISMGTDSKREITVSRLHETEWHESTLTWSSSVFELDRHGNMIPIFSSDIGTWVKVSITNLLHSSQNSSIDKIILQLENRGAASGQSHVNFGSIESGYSPRLAIDDATLYPTVPPTKFPTQAPTLTSQPTSENESATSENDSAIIPVAVDAYIRSGKYAVGNYGMESELVVKNNGSSSDYTRKSILKFDLKEYDFSVPNSLILRIYVDFTPTQGSRTIEIKRLTNYDDWKEYELTWNSFTDVEMLPQTKSFTVESTDAKKWLEVDISSLIGQNEDKLVLFLDAVKNSGEYVSFGSRESGYGSELVKQEAYLIEAVADTYIRGGKYANNNYGTENYLVIKWNGKNDYLRKTIITFNTSAVPANITSASLRLYVIGEGTSMSSASVSIKVSKLDATDWTEDTVTWNNFNVANSDDLLITKSDLNSWVDVDITELLLETPGDTLTVFLEKLSISEDYIKFGAKESDNPPKIIIV